MRKSKFKRMDQIMQNKWRLAGLVFALLNIATAPHVHSASWRVDQAQMLQQLIAASPEDALPILDTSGLDGALRDGPSAELDSAANGLALRLARMHLLGVSTAQQKAGWRIADSDQETDIKGWLQRALGADALATFFMSVRPAHPDYAALRAAYAQEADPGRRLTLARNMERWRWLPRTLGDDYVLVNAPFFEARLWRGGKHAGSWPVIVGKTSTPTPVFSALITGVTFNPWWNIPASIVRERGGRFPSSQGYVHSRGQWRQKPGPNNALGQMKLVMPNPYSVYMHDTPSKHLFAREVRAFSHGCIRTGDALGFAATLLSGAKTRAEVDAVVKSRTTVTFDLPKPLPVYVTYFTAAPAPDGTVIYKTDIYGRDARVGDASNPNRSCDA
jgi:L,D-transpeptidase YcbB